jgi:hypothetical protein
MDVMREVLYYDPMMERFYIRRELPTMTRAEIMAKYGDIGCDNTAWKKLCEMEKDEEYKRSYHK